MNIRLCDIAGAVDGALEGGDPEREVSMVSVDSRTIRPGEAFFALKGPNFDGHRFINAAFARGAACAVVGAASRASLPDGLCLIVTADTLSALGRLASYVRGLYNIPVIAISGSSGKTTTKEMTASILGRSRRVLKTEGNRNNLVGLPLTLFGLDRTHEAAVLELGISEPWEMERLVKISSPDVALITNIGRGHLKTLGSLEGVAKAKAALFDL
ncbi:MAG: UDP-N-acetylmuramoyl-tripeptide--D-alanyl-D-alanine ligase [Deltaproteobacteria bacterium]|nr:UDP-N-acetylmuramoyl-tripeptide--D-alanyl-D-alanine ligase [Deltaproteobacteria bacterium]